MFCRLFRGSAREEVEGGSFRTLAFARLLTATDTKRIHKENRRLPTNIKGNFTNLSQCLFDIFKNGLRNRRAELVSRRIFFLYVVGEQFDVYADSRKAAFYAVGIGDELSENAAQLFSPLKISFSRLSPQSTALTPS